MYSVRYAHGPLPQEPPEEQEKLKRPFDALPTMHFQLPGSIYASAMLVFLGAKKEEYEGMNCLFTLSIVVPQVVLLALNVVIQISFVQYLERAYAGLDVCDIETDLVLRYLALAAFVAGMIFEVFECIEMFIWTYQVKTEESHQPLQLLIKEDGSKELASGLTICQKLLFALLAVSTKLGISIYLFLVGAEFVVMSATHSDLILNCLAMLFVVEIDDMIYQGFTPSFLKEVIEDLPPVRLEGFKRAAFQLCGLPWLKLLLWLVSVHLIIRMHACD